ncbi:MAG: nucleotidyltransferase domain-containing protein [Thermoplasmata archaeon]
MNERIKKVLEEFKTRLRQIYGKRLRNIILYGSWARNEATEGSDIDLIVVLKGEVVPGKETEVMIDAITDILLEYGELISLYPVSEKDYESVMSPLLMNARKEGVPT